MIANTDKMTILNVNETAMKAITNVLSSDTNSIPTVTPKKTTKKNPLANKNSATVQAENVTASRNLGQPPYQEKSKNTNERTYNVEGTNIGSLARQLDYSQDWLQYIADTRLENVSLNETGKSIPDKEHKFVMVSATLSISARRRWAYPSLWPS